METQPTIIDDDDGDTLSLRDLPINSLRSSPRTSTTSTQDLFEFFSGTDPYPNRPDIIFCGKIIPDNNNDNETNNNKHDHISLTKSISFHFRRPERSVSDLVHSDNETNNKHDHISLTKSISFRFRRPERSVSDRVHGSGSGFEHTPATVKFSTSVKKVNITSLTNMSATSRRRMFMFGPVKFKPEMDLTAIKERQGRRTQVSMFTPAVESGGGRGRRCSHSSHWGIVRNLRCRAQRDHLSTVLVRSLGCIPNH